MQKRAHFLTVTGAALALAPRRLGAQTLEKIRLSAVPTDDMTPIFYAIKNGAYQKAGIDLEVVPVSSGSASTAAVIAGAYEMGKASPVASLLAHVRGLPLTIVANGAIYVPRTPFNLIIVASDSTMKTGADCNGKTAAVFGLNDITHLAMMNWVDKNGGDSTTMKFVEIPNSAAGAAVGEHRVDMTTLNEPQLTSAIEGGKVKALTDAFAAVSNRWLTSAYLAQPEWAKKNAEALRRFSRVTYETTAYTNNHKPETLSMMSEITKIPMPVFSKITRIEGTTTPEPALLQPVIDLMVKYKVIPRAFPPREMYFTG